MSNDHHRDSSEGEAYHLVTHTDDLSSSAGADSLFATLTASNSTASYEAIPLQTLEQKTPERATQATASSNSTSSSTTADSATDHLICHELKDPDLLHGFAVNHAPTVSGP